MSSVAHAEHASVSRDSRLRLDTDSGNFYRIGGYMQVRSAFSYIDSPDAGDQELASGFDLRRAKLISNGAIAGGDVRFKAVAIATGSGALSFEDLTIGFDAGDVAVTVGQFKGRLLREELMPSSVQLTADRSVVNTVFSLVYTQGVMFEGTLGDETRWSLSFNDGSREQNSPVFTEANDFAFTGRIEHSPGGAFKRFNTFSSFRGEAEGKTDWLFAAAAHFESGGETQGTSDRDRIFWAAEASAEGDGWSLFGTAIGRWTDPGSGESFYDAGLLGQASVFVSEQTELFGRVDAVIADDDGPAPDDFTTVTGGFNFYPIEQSRAIRFTVEGLWFLAGTDGSPVNASRTTNLRAASRSGQAAARAQVVVQF